MRWAGRRGTGLQRVEVCACGEGSVLSARQTGGQQGKELLAIGHSIPSESKLLQS